MSCGQRSEGSGSGRSSDASNDRAAVRFEPLRKHGYFRGHRWIHDRA
ncbi:hypothetical protein LC55x_5504 [Lysobacter capsici]|nr:hypothetical protein LC55x_5504 [Lysobacter capsici]